MLQRTHSIQLTDSGGRVLHSSGLNHYNPLSPLVFIRNSPNRQTLRPPPHLRIRASAFCHPARGFSLRHLARQVGGLALGFSPVFLLDTMVQIIEHRDLSPDDFLTEEGATSSMPRGSNRPAPGAAAMHAARQHTPVQTSKTPSRAAPGGTLSTARELLRNPPSSTVSPGAMRQRREDVDRLLGMAHPSSARSRPRSFRRQREASASVRSPSVRGAQTDDLRVELNRRRVGKDARVSLERARERRQNFKGRNLDQDFTARDARIQAGVPLVGVVCAALADHLRAVTWPPKFWTHLPENYDGTSNP
jgi:hypothetical protein